jgi:hypothetical protein
VSGASERETVRTLENPKRLLERVHDLAGCGDVLHPDQLDPLHVPDGAAPLRIVGGSGLSR